MTTDATIPATRFVRTVRAAYARHGDAGRALAAALALSAVGAALYLPHILHGGRWSDDWADSASWALTPARSPLSLLAVSGRVLSGPYYGAVYSVFGLNTHLQIAWACATGVLLALSSLVALVSYGLPRRHALPVAGLVLAFAPADSVRLWPAAANANVAAALFLWGAAVAASAWRATGRRRIALHIASLAFYMLSVFTYETAAGAIALSVIGYRCVTSTRNAVARWTADLLIVFLGVAVATASNNHASEPLSGELFVHAAKLLAGAVLVASWGVFPVGATHSPNFARLVGGAIIVGAIVVGVRRARHDPQSKYWLRWIGAGLLFALAAYATYLPAAGYTPVGRGIANRTNVLSEVGMVVAAYSTARLLARAVAQQWRAPRQGFVAALLMGLLAVGYVVGTARDERAWDAAAHKQAVVLGRLTDVVRRPLPGTTLVVFGAPPFQSPGVPVFYAPWDLSGAAELHWHELRLAAWPVAEGLTVICGDRLVGMAGPNFTGLRTGYRRLVFVDLRAGRQMTVSSSVACLHWLRTVTAR